MSKSLTFWDPHTAIDFMLLAMQAAEKEAQNLQTIPRVLVQARHGVQHGTPSCSWVSSQVSDLQGLVDS